MEHVKATLAQKLSQAVATHVATTINLSGQVPS